MLPASSCPSCATANDANGSSATCSRPTTASSSSPRRPSAGATAAAAGGSAGGAAATAAAGSLPRRRRWQQRQQGLVVLGLPMLMMLSSLLLLGRTAAIQLDVDPYTTRVRSPTMTAMLALLAAPCGRPSDRPPNLNRSICIYIQCIMDEYAPEEESALKLRAVGRVQEGVRATVRVLSDVYVCTCGCGGGGIVPLSRRWNRSTGRPAGVV